MKRFRDLRTPVFLLMVSVLSLSLFTGCGKKTDIGIRFEMEKMMADADRLGKELSIKGPSLSEEDLNSLVEAYAAITLKISPPRDSQEVADAADAKKEAWALALMANTRMGIIYLDQEMYDKALFHFEAVIGHPATDDLRENGVINLIALTMEKARRFPEAAASYDSLAIGYRRIITPDSLNLNALAAPIKAAEMWLMAGNSLEFGRRLETARDYYNDLIQKYPDSPLEAAATGKIAASYLKQGRFTEAIEVLQSTRNENTRIISPNILMMIANIYMNNLRDSRKAEQTYREFISSHPDDGQLASAYLGLGLSLFERRMFSESRQAVGNIERLPHVNQATILDANYLIALCYDMEGKWELSKGQLDYIQGSFPGTDKAFEAALYIANRYRSRGQTELAQKAFDNAEKYISKYADLTGQNPVSISRAMGYLVRCYTEQEDHDQAARILTQLYQSFPLLPEGRFAPIRLANLYETALYDTSSAIHWLKAFVDGNPENENLETLKARIRRLEAATGK